MQKNGVSASIAARNEEKIAELEKRIIELRLSRRILMTLFEQEQLELSLLRQENRRLQRRLHTLSTRVWQYQSDSMKIKRSRQYERN